MVIGWLTMLVVLFIARVAGQILVVLVQPKWLPPMKDWYSGLLAYPILLPSQLVIIALMIAMTRQIAAAPPANRPLAVGIFGFATLYALAMAIRFVILRRNHPDYRWYEGGMIPIMFHGVLAAFLFTYASQRL